jgi:hypothetical protein
MEQQYQPDGGKPYSLPLSVKQYDRKPAGSGV